MKLEVLKLDFDGYSFREIKKLFEKRGLWLKRFFKLHIQKINVYKTKKGYHIYIWVNNRLSNQDIVFLQLAFGSDYMRECYYWKRIKYPILPKRGWNILFYKKNYCRKSRKKPSFEEFDDKKSFELLKVLKLDWKK